MYRIQDKDDEIVRTLIVHEKILGFLGIWPLKVQTFEFTFRWFLAMSIQVSMISTLALEVYKHCTGIDDVMDAFLMDLSSTVSLSKVFLVRFNWKHTRALVTSMIEDWSTIENLRYREIMIKYSKKGRLVALLILYLSYACAVSFAVMALPLDSLLFWTKVQVNKTAKASYLLATYCVYGDLPFAIYNCVLILQVAQIIVSVIAHSGNDGFFFSLTMYLCGQFEILQMRFACLNVERHNCREQIRTLIKRHWHLIRLANDLEYTFTAVIPIQMLMSTLLLCVEGFQMIISLNTGDTFAVTKHAVIIVTMLVQLFLYAYAGDALESQTEGLTHGIYDCQWYNADVKVAKDLSFMMLRGIIPHEIMVAKFIPMNLFSFKNILKASASYLSLLRVMVDT